MSAVDYKMAGVDIAAGNEAVRRIKHLAEGTFSKNVLSPIGGFGALYDLKSLLSEYQHPILVQSIDGVGTKTIIARMMNKFDTIGMDLVSATANDIVVLGATPLTLLDYIASEQLNPDVIEQIVSGIAKACLDNNISLVGGETAEMPQTYLPGETDLVGVITGVVEKDAVINGRDIQPHDVVLGIPSSGLHTNGYSLARKLLFDVANYHVDSWNHELDCTLGKALLEPHINYTKPVLDCLKNKIKIKGMAHITGGGFLDNIPRILPQGTGVSIQLGTWPISPLFTLLEELGRLDQAELFRTFNMGIGLVMIVGEDQVDGVRQYLQAYEIGRVTHSHEKTVRII